MFPEVAVSVQFAAREANLIHADEVQTVQTALRLKTYRDLSALLGTALVQAARETKARSGPVRDSHPATDQVPGHR